MIGKLRWVAALLSAGMMFVPAAGAAVLQCVPYARAVSGVAIRGDALTWWDQAEGQYKRGHAPKKGAVLAFRPVGPMTLGHVAVVSRIVDDRHVLIRHANWSVPGAIEEDVPAIDVSDAGDWSEVRVWHSPTGQMGARVNPTYGFIYPAKAGLHDFAPDPALGASVRFARADMTGWKDRGADAPAAMTADAAPSVRTAAMVQYRGVRVRPARHAAPRLETDMAVADYADYAPAERTLSAIIADVKRDTMMN